MISNEINLNVTILRIYKNTSQQLKAVTMLTFFRIYIKR